MIQKRYVINKCVSFFKHNIDVHMCAFLYVSARVDVGWAEVMPWHNTSWVVITD